MQPLSPRLALIANGEVLSYQKTKALLSHYETIIAIDGGLEHCEKMDVTPSMIVGDLDSISTATLDKYSHIKLLKCPKDKDESDLELAIKELLKQGIDSMALFGVLGKRVDHLLYTLYLLTRYPQHLVIVSEDEIIFCLQKQNKISASPGQTISLIPLNEVVNVHSKGLKWELNHVNLDKHFLSLSNISLGDSFQLDLHSGDLLCCMQKLNP